MLQLVLELANFAPTRQNSSHSKIQQTPTHTPQPPPPHDFCLRRSPYLCMIAFLHLVYHLVESNRWIRSFETVKPTLVDETFRTRTTCVKVTQNIISAHEMLLTTVGRVQVRRTNHSDPSSQRSNTQPVPRGHLFDDLGWSPVHCSASSGLHNALKPTNLQCLPFQLNQHRLIPGPSRAHTTREWSCVFHFTIACGFT